MTLYLKRTMSRRKLLAGSAGSVIAVVAVGVPISTGGKAYPGTQIQGVDISGFSVPTTEQVLLKTFATFEERAVTFIYGEREWHASLADLGMSIDYPTMLEQAMKHGRDGSFLERYTLLRQDAHERDISLLLNQNETILRDFLENIGREIAVAPADARLEARDGKAVVVEPVEGRELDLEMAVEATNRKVLAGRWAKIELPTRALDPKIKASALEQARQDASLMVSAPVWFTHEGLYYSIDAWLLASSLTIGSGNTPLLAPEAFAPRIEAIDLAVSVPPTNVKLGWDGGLYVVESDVDGVVADRDALASAIQELARGTTREAPLPAKVVRAPARADNLQELGIAGHVATGSSSFAGSSAARAENVVVSAHHLSYKLVAPGENYSFNDMLGSITRENGFVEGTIIQGDWTATDIGGGVCQVSTTVFRAAANAGFQFSEWNPHSWRLAFYEADGSPPGYDGAIYQPNAPDEWEKDLIFTNPLGSWLLLQVLTDGGTVSAHLYGTGNGWTVYLGEPRLSAPKSIPLPVERVNPDLALGERILVQEAQAGVTVALRRTVIAADGSTISDGDFISDYQSIPEAWEIGPG